MKAKICGITSVEDAQFALEAGADLIGLIFSKSSKRTVALEQAQRILKALGENSSKVVGVFLDEPIQEVTQFVKELDLKWVQLHAPKTPQELTPLAHLKKLLVIPVDEMGSYIPIAYPPENGILLYDNSRCGTGVPFNWDKFVPQTRHPFFMAGGLSSHNVEEVFKRFKPDGVDVASGVSGPDLIKKDPIKVKEFVQKAHHAE